MRLACAMVTLGALVLASTVLTGCATQGIRPATAGGDAHERASDDKEERHPGLWTKRLYQSAEDPHLALALAGNGKDVLVCYDERCGTSQRVHRRAYWLFAHRAKGDNPGKPHFTNPEIYNRLAPVAVLGVAETNAAPAIRYRAFTTLGSPGFQLTENGRSLGYFNLPVYRAGPPGTAWRVGATVVVVAVGISIFCLSCLAYAPAPG